MSFTKYLIYILFPKYTCSWSSLQEGTWALFCFRKIWNLTEIMDSVFFSSLDPPAFILTRSPSSGQVEEGTSVSFSFRATEPGNPSTYTFRECDHSVDGTSLRNIPYSEVPSRISFTIQNVSITDRGRYTCRVTNNITNQNGGSIVEDSISLEVKSKYLQSFDILCRTSKFEEIIIWHIFLDFWRIFFVCNICNIFFIQILVYMLVGKCYVYWK